MRSGVRSGARHTTKQLSKLVTQLPAPVSVEYLGWSHACSQLSAVAAVSFVPAAFVPSASRKPKAAHTAAHTAQGCASTAKRGDRHILKHAVGKPESVSRLRKCKGREDTKEGVSRGVPSPVPAVAVATAKGFDSAAPAMAKRSAVENSCLTSALLLDSLPAVMAALAAGVDAACVLLRVDCLIAESS